MSIKEAVLNKLRKANISFVTVNVYNNVDGEAVEVVRQDRGTKLNYTIQVDKAKEADAEYVANVVMSYITNGRNNWQV